MRYLIIRLSAFGDVAMTIPVLYAVAKANPQHSFTFLTRPELTGLLLQAPDNVESMGIDIKRDERRLPGLLRYTSRLAEEKFDKVIDLHNVLRSKIIRIALRLRGVKSKHLHKPRKAWALLTAYPPLKHKMKLCSMVERYANVVRSAGLHFELPNDNIPTICIPQSDIRVVEERLGILPSERISCRIGIAPFAAHNLKTYPIDRMQILVEKLSSLDNVDIILFGAKGKEQDVLNEWAEKYPNCFSLAGKLSLPEELAIMQTLKCMVSMDSANMHFASLLGIRVVSIWCATHPYAGFLGYGQKEEDVITLDMPCSPCSTFGNKPCRRHDVACKNIDVELIYKHLVENCL